GGVLGGGGGLQSQPDRLGRRSCGRAGLARYSHHLRAGHRAAALCRAGACLRVRLPAAPAIGLAYGAAGAIWYPAHFPAGLSLRPQQHTYAAPAALSLHAGRHPDYRLYEFARRPAAAGPTPAETQRLTWTTRNRSPCSAATSRSFVSPRESSSFPWMPKRTSAPPAYGSN